jgi:hypothetical protein
VALDLAGAALRVVLLDEDRGVLPELSVADGVDDPAGAQSLSATSGSGVGYSGLLPPVWSSGRVINVRSGNVPAVAYCCRCLAKMPAHGVGSGQHEAEELGMEVRSSDALSPLAGGGWVVEL